MPNLIKQYLGDGAYAQYDDYGVILTTENGVAIQNKIYLEPEVALATVRYLFEHIPGLALHVNQNIMPKFLSKD